MVEKNKILKLSSRSFFIIDHIFHQAGHYLLTAEILPNAEIGDKPYIFQEVEKDQKLFFKRITNVELLSQICPIFEHNLKSTTTLEDTEYLPRHPDYNSQGVSIQETVEANPHIFIMAECIPACLELWGKNIYTLMVSDAANENVCWIEVKVAYLSEENMQVYEALSGLNVIKFSYHEGTVNFGINYVGKKGQAELLKLAKQFKMQDVPKDAAFISPEEFLLNKCGCYEEYPNPDYIEVTTPEDLRLPGDTQITFLNRVIEWQMGRYNTKTLKRFASDKVTRPVAELAAEHGMIFEDGRVYLNDFHYQKHLNFINFQNSQHNEQPKSR